MQLAGAHTCHMGSAVKKLHQRCADMCPAGKELRAKGLNRIGNMLVPNSNYCLFEDWIMPLLDQMLKEQQDLGTVWTPSKVTKHQSSFGRVGDLLGHRY